MCVHCTDVLEKQRCPRDWAMFMGEIWFQRYLILVGEGAKMRQNRKLERVETLRTVISKMDKHFLL